MYGESQDNPIYLGNVSKPSLKEVYIKKVKFCTKCPVFTPLDYGLSKYSKQFLLPFYFLV